jgi:hypothetical protein
MKTTKRKNRKNTVKKIKQLQANLKVIASLK